MAKIAIFQAIFSLSASPDTHWVSALQDQGDLTQLMAAQEELKTAPFGEVWDEYCHRCNKPVDGTWFSEIQSYEKRILEERR